METCNDGGMSDYKKKEVAYQKKVAGLEGKAGNNPVIKGMTKDSKEEKNEIDDKKHDQWRMVQDATRSARELFMEEDMTFEESVKNLIAALGIIAGSDSKGKGGKTNKQMAKEAGLI